MGSPAAVYGAERAEGVNTRMRKAQSLVPLAATRDFIVTRLQQAMPAIGEYFGVPLRECEKPQFLRYEAGGHFVAHQDGNTPLTRDDTRFRLISTVIMLSEPSETPQPGTYGGGLLVLHGKYPDFDQRTTVAREPGTLGAFRSETTHEVTPVTHGERYTIVSWYR